MPSSHEREQPLFTRAVAKRAAERAAFLDRECAGDTLDVAAVNKLGESVRATPGIAGETLYVRSPGHLWAFGE